MAGWVRIKCTNDLFCAKYLTRGRIYLGKLTADKLNYRVIANDRHGHSLRNYRYYSIARFEMVKP